MTFRCHLCAGDRGRRLFPATDRLYGQSGVYWLVRCESCTLIHTDPVPPVIRNCYPSDYPAYQPLPQVRRAPRWLRRLFDPACYFIPSLPRGSRVLEIGCGAGAFLVEIARCGWEVTVLDISREAIAIAGRLAGRAIVGTLEEARLPSDSFDAVFAWMLVEHLPDPVTTLREVARILKPGAVFSFSVPNAEGGMAAWRELWCSLMVPTHLHHFTRRTLVRLLRQAGLRATRFTEQRTLLPQLSTLALAANARGWIDWMNRHVRAMRALTHPLACVAAALRMSDALTVVARKPG